MFIPLLLERHSRDLALLANHFTQGTEVYDFWLRLRALLAEIVGESMLPQQLTYGRFEDIYTRSIHFLNNYLKKRDLTETQKEMIGAFLDHWQWTREALKQTIDSPRSFFTPAELKLARQYHLDNADLQKLSGLHLFGSEVEDVFEYVGGMKLRRDDRKTRMWVRNSDCCYTQTLRDFTFVVFYRKGQPVKLIKADRQPFADIPSAVSPSS